MKKSLQSLVLLLMAFLLPATAAAAYEQLADGVFQDGSTLYIGSGVTSLGDLQVNPNEIYCYATIPPACVSNTFTGYGAILHVPVAGMVSYFTALYWYNFNNILSDAIEPLSVTMSVTEVEMEMGQHLSLSATVVPSDATPKTLFWTSTNSSVATVSNGGTVTAVTEGECYILAKCIDKVAICHVMVVSSRVTITLDNHEARLLPNHTMTLTATCSPIDVDLVVTSSNLEVAIPRLVNGAIMVVGVSEGSATIMVNAVDGWANPDSCTVTVYTERGDVNCDGYVNISDVTKLIDFLLSDNPEGLSTVNTDTNCDGKISITDVTILIEFLLSGKWPGDEPVIPPDDHEYVDLGLPSGTLWATCNVGANNPEDYGSYFAWGEITPKATYSWSNYKWCKGAKNKLTKYCTNSTYGTVDNRKELELEDDAAYMNWGSSWRIPTYTQLMELKNNCTWRWTTMNGVNGCLGTGPNGNTLFFPAAGKKEGSLSSVGTGGWCWSRNQDSGTYDAFSFEAWCMGYSSTISSVTRGLRNERYYGWSVRAVRILQD